MSNGSRSLPFIGMSLKRLPYSSIPIKHSCHTAMYSIYSPFKGEGKRLFWKYFRAIKPLLLQFFVSLMPVKPADLVMSTVLGALQSQYLCILYTHKYYLSWSVYESGACSFKGHVAHNLTRMEKKRIMDISQTQQSLFPKGHSRCFWPW